MVRYLGLTTSFDAILDKLDSLNGLVSTFDVILQGFYRESEGRSKPVAHDIARLEGKLNEIHIKHLNRVSAAETAGYIIDLLFYGFWKPLQEGIHAKFDNPVNDYIVLMHGARKAEDKH